jgi:hypothetical protein
VGSEVGIGDLIMEVNGISAPKEMETQLKKTLIGLRVTRLPNEFEVTLCKNGLDVGMTVKKSRHSSGHVVLICNISRSGAVARHNEQQASDGRWDNIVSAKMSIIGVNGVTDDASRMVELIHTSETFNLRVRRSAPTPVRSAPRGFGAFRAVGFVTGALHPGSPSSPSSPKHAVPQSHFEDPTRPQSAGAKLFHNDSAGHRETIGKSSSVHGGASSSSSSSAAGL